jgi:hypothetical protein
MWLTRGSAMSFTPTTNGDRKRQIVAQLEAQERSSRSIAPSTPAVKWRPQSHKVLTRTERLKPSFKFVIVKFGICSELY